MTVVPCHVFKMALVFFLDRRYHGHTRPSGRARLPPWHLPHYVDRLSLLKDQHSDIDIDDDSRNIDDSSHKRVTHQCRIPSDATEQHRQNRTDEGTEDHDCKNGQWNHHGSVHGRRQHDGTEESNKAKKVPNKSLAQIPAIQFVSIGSAWHLPWPAM